MDTAISKLSSAFKKPAPTEADKLTKNYQAAKRFEAYFVGNVFEEALKNMERSDLFGESENQGMFDQMMVQHLADQLANSPRGLGLADQMVGNKVIPKSPTLMSPSLSLQAPEVEKGDLSFELPLAGRLTSNYGVRIDPVDGSHKHHAGLDLAAPKGDPIHAAEDGVVVFSGIKGGYGNTVMVKHDNTYTSLYGHASELKVKEGQKVQKGDVIALVGSTGKSTGPHLHFEIRKEGKAVDPKKIISLSKKI